MKLNKNIDPHFNNLVFSMYNFAKAKQKAAKAAGNDEKKSITIPVDILKMLKRKIGTNLTVDEERLLDSLIFDLQGKQMEKQNSIQYVSLFEAQEELMREQKSRAYSLNSTVEEAFSMVQIKGTIVQIMLGDLTLHPVEAIVSPDTTDLWMDQGVASVIRLKGGDVIRKEARKSGSIQVGEVRVTPAGDLMQRYVFHTAIIIPKEETNRENIEKALKSIFSAAEENKVKSIAIPALGIASSKFPYNVMAKITIQSVFQYLLNVQDTPVKLVVISMFNKEAYGYFVEQFKSVAAVNSLKVEDFH